MKKVAIVGVEGSGKTVLMAAMGEQYRKPRGDGLFLYANSRKTIEYCNEQIDILRNRHRWPDSTPPDSLVNLEWTLMRRKKGVSPEEVCSIAFLDFAGEIYRYAFNDSEDDNEKIKQNQYKRQIDAVKAHLKDARSVMVLVNLSDIINSSGVSRKATEMGWLSQRIFDFIFSETSATRVAIVFTQKDLYEETIIRCGGLEGAFEEYLPSVFYRHESQITPFAVSAVNKTVPDGKDEIVPAPDFDSDGLDDLLLWAAGIGNDGSMSKSNHTVQNKTEEFLQAWHARRYYEAAKLMSDVVLNEDTMYVIAAMYEHGRGVEKDYSKAVAFYQKVIDEGSHGERETMALQAIQRITKMKISVSHAKSDSVHEAEAISSFENATSKFLRLYRAGSYDQAAQLIEDVDKNCIDVQLALGFMYWLGRGVKKSTSAGIVWFGQAARAGDPCGQRMLGDIYRSANGVLSNYGEAIKWYCKVIDNRAGGLWKCYAAYCLFEIYKERKMWLVSARWWLRWMFYKFGIKLLWLLIGIIAVVGGIIRLNFNVWGNGL